MSRQAAFTIFGSLTAGRENVQAAASAASVNLVG